MPATPLDSALYRGLLGDGALHTLFSDSAEVRAMLLVEGALAHAQGKQGLIPETSAAAIHRAAREVEIDPGALAAATGENAVPVPALVASFREAMNAPEHAQFVHWGATSQDIVDTALMLRLRQALALLSVRLSAILDALANLAEAHADLPMPGRTWGQAAVPTTFGAVAAAWGGPLLRHAKALTDLRETHLAVSLSGAAGTLSVMGADGPTVRAGMAKELGLADPGGSWHGGRDRVAGIGAWLTGVTVSIGKMGEDLILLTQTGIGEVALGTAGASSTMPQKANPVVPALLSALARAAPGLNATLQGAALHRQERDGAAWIAEWLSFPQLCLTAGRALAAAEELCPRIAPVPEKMTQNLALQGGAIHAEALTFALAQRMPRPDAAAEVKRLITTARDRGETLKDIARADHPDLDPSVFDPAANLGQAPGDARAFAASVRALPSSIP